MNARAVLVLVVLPAILGGGALIYLHQENAEWPGNVATLGKPLLPDLKAADIANIKIVQPNATLTLRRKENGWVIAERRNFHMPLPKLVLSMRPSEQLIKERARCFVLQRSEFEPYY